MAALKALENGPKEEEEEKKEEEEEKEEEIEEFEDRSTPGKGYLCRIYMEYTIINGI